MELNGNPDALRIHRNFKRVIACRASIARGLITTRNIYNGWPIDPRAVYKISSYTGRASFKIQFVLPTVRRGRTGDTNITCIPGVSLPRLSLYTL